MLGHELTGHWSSKHLPLTVPTNFLPSLTTGLPCHVCTFLVYISCFLSPTAPWQYVAESRLCPPPTSQEPNPWFFIKRAHKLGSQGAGEVRQSLEMSHRQLQGTLSGTDTFPPFSLMHTDTQTAYAKHCHLKVPNFCLKAPIATGCLSFVRNDPEKQTQ